jgi:hypothetical protein
MGRDRTVERRRSRLSASESTEGGPDPLEVVEQELDSILTRARTAAEGIRMGTAKSGISALRQIEERAADALRWGFGRENA